VKGLVSAAPILELLQLAGGGTEWMRRGIPRAHDLGVSLMRAPNQVVAHEMLRHHEAVEETLVLAVLMEEVDQKLQQGRVAEGDPITITATPPPRRTCPRSHLTARKSAFTCMLVTLQLYLMLRR
jgi:hypothetical protein